MVVLEIIKYAQLNKIIIINIAMQAKITISKPDYKYYNSNFAINELIIY